MMLRSMLFTPGDSQKKMDKGATGAADALILDLEDSVTAARRPEARIMVRDYLVAKQDRTTQQLWVRINPLDTPDALLDLAAIISGRPDGIILPKVDGPADVTTLAHYLDALEPAFDISSGRVKIMPVATETAPSIFALGGYKHASPRLHGLTWGAEDIAAALGASANRDANGALYFTYQMARSLCLAGAIAADVVPVETVYPDFRDLAGLEAYAVAGKRDGFRGMMAIHPDQVAIINRAFTPTDKEIMWATRVVEAFAASSDGVVGLDGQMLDMPHLKQARRLLDTAAQSEWRR
ncbi:MAG: CoA ester lyase [Tardiphaga sp.]|nr:CoA ester lyase [Tardiphaga sp.]